MRTTFLGYQVFTDAPEICATFLAQARAHYDTLEQTLGPIKEAVNELQQDWEPRRMWYWQNVLNHLVPVRQALGACVWHFGTERSQSIPIPRHMAAAAISYLHDVHRLECKLEEAGLLLTSHSAVLPSLEEAHLRQRQRVVKALRALLEEGQKVVTASRVKLDEAQEKANQQSSMQSSAPTSQPALQLVSSEAQRSQEEEAGV